MKVIKRDGSIEDVDFNKITTRIRKIIDKNNLSIDPIILSQKICSSIHDNIKTTELDSYAADLAISMSSNEYEYATLASCILVSDIHKNLRGISFSKLLSNMNDITDDIKNIVIQYRDTLESVLDYNRDYLFDYFGIKTLERAYLEKDEYGNICERPQDLFMRVSLGIHGNDIKRVIETYYMMSNKKFIHATPTLFNAGKKNGQLASCFLQSIGDDCITDIYGTLSKTAQISKYAGGIGMHIHNIRSKGSMINGKKNLSQGIIPMLKVYNDTARYINQNGKRPGSIAIYLQVDHPDIFDFLDLKKNTGDEEARARDLFYALWIPDLFMERVKNNEMWSLMCPHECPGLSDVYGSDYNELYKSYELKGLYKKQVKAQELWYAICTSQIETGLPYMLYKDSINTKSNQKNVGVIKSSNLCCEICIYSSKEETAVCNLASICLPSYLNNGEFDYVELRKISRILTRNLNNVIDNTYYPTIETKRSNLKHRPIGIGVQGLADVYIKMNLSFESDKAKIVNKKIFETIYIGAIEESIQLAKYNGAYESFEGSPISKGIFQFNMWDIDESTLMYTDEWDRLRNDIKLYGIRNSLLVAPMPTASTSQIMGNNECFEPYTSNIYLRRTLAGEFVVVNKHLVKELNDLGLWNTNIKNDIIKHNGSIQHLDSVPDSFKSIYKTVWEISQRVIIDQAVDRSAFVCQSQSMNLFISDPTMQKLTSMHFYAWSNGLKTGMYYLRTKPASNPIQFTIEPTCEMCSG